MASEDKYPVTANHMLVSPNRHVSSFFNLGASEEKACILLVDDAKKKIVREDTTVTGFNVGINDGVHAAQTVMHCHIHLILRKDDVADLGEEYVMLYLAKDTTIKSHHL